MCARHDLTVGGHLLELEPIAGAVPGTILLYVTMSDLSNGDVCWKGCVDFRNGPSWEVTTYGGIPLQLDCPTAEVESP